MKYLLIRHGETDANRLTRAAFGKSGAPLNEIGKQQALQLRNALASIGIDKNQRVAISEFQRTKQTANLAGFSRTTANPLLN
ncbi:MAG: histidine phosphatase family protein, partial [Candidatus Saccharimonadales bacterium]